MDRAQTFFALHIVLHILVPGAIAWFAFRNEWRRAWGVMAATMLVDLDHLLAATFLVLDRCSIGFHPLHSYPAIVLYGVMLLNRRTRIVGTGLLVHMALDFSECLRIG